MAEAIQCNLIVMGTRGPKRLSSLVMGSVAEEVVRRAPCPVVTLRSSAADMPSSETLAPETACISEGETPQHDSSLSECSDADWCSSVALVVADQETD
jgi:hypothetical protein